MVVGQVWLAGSSQNLSFIHLQPGKSDFSDWKYGAGCIPALCSEFVPAAAFCGSAVGGEVGAQSWGDCLAVVWDRRKLLGPLEC